MEPSPSITQKENDDKQTNAEKRILEENKRERV